MSKKFKSQASSSRAATGAFGASAGTFGSFPAGSGGSPSSLSYISEPPDLTLISQPQLVVAFKNLLKKDSTTKSKALEELQDFISTPGGENEPPEDSLLEAWVKIFPRLSIDTSRRVRQLAHTVQGHIVSLSGKRIARHIPKVIGAWLAGLYDNDKPVSRAAQESVIRAFPTEEKRHGVWKAYQSAILEFVVDAVLEQTALTLSDERTTKPDDAQAKYTRVVATAVQVLNALISRASSIEKDIESIRNLFESKTLWQFAHNDDPFARRSIYSLLRTSLSADVDLWDWKLISTHVLSRSLPINQYGSASDFSDILVLLTAKHPSIWTSDYSGKTSATKRLYQYIRNGSQGVSTLYWNNLDRLLQSVPTEVLLTDGADTVKSASDLMKAIHEGILNKDEQRINTEASWLCFVDTAFWILTLISDGTNKQDFIQAHICPILKQYVMAIPEDSHWNLNERYSLNLASKCAVSLAETTGQDILPVLWTAMSDLLIEAIKISSPEQSLNFRSNQDTICSQLSRLFGLERKVLARTSGRSDLTFVRIVFHESTASLLQPSLEVLRARNGKPYSAAAMIEEAVAKVPSITTDFDDLDTLLIDDIPKFLFSPSGDRLTSILFRCRGRKEFETGLTRTMNALYEADWGTSVVFALRKLFSSVTKDDIAAHADIGSLVDKDLDRALKANGDAWTDIAILLNNPASHDGLENRVIGSVMDSLSSDGTVKEALHGLSRIRYESAQAMREFVNGPGGSALVSKLLLLAESPVDEIAHISESLGKDMKDIMKGESGVASSIDIVQRNFREVGAESLSVDSLVPIAHEVLEKTPPEDKARILSHLLPAKDHWEAALRTFLLVAPKKSAPITNSLGGATYLVDRSDPSSLPPDLDAIPRDPNHFSAAFRLMFYVTKVLSEGNLEYIEQRVKEELFFYFPLAVQLVDDELAMEGSTGVLLLDSVDMRDELADLVSEARLLVRYWIDSDTASMEIGGTAGPHIVYFWENRLESLRSNSPRSYRIAESFVKIVSQRKPANIADSAERGFKLAKQVDGPSNPFALPSVVAAFRDFIATGALGFRLCNELMADLTGPDLRDESKGLRNIVTLNLLVQSENTVAQNVPTQRLVFLVKSLIQSLESGESSPGLTSEILKLLTVVFPLIKEIYGSHWSSALEILGSLWDETTISDGFLPVLHSSLRLFSCLRVLASGEESNDDLEDAWITAQKTLPSALVKLLAEFDSSSNDLPRSVTAELLARQISSVSVDQLDDVTNLFSVLAVQSRGIQRAAYDVLHRVIPKSQEDLSVEVAVSKSTARLPDELISLLFETPSIGVLYQPPVEESVWIDLRCYLLSWKTVFDHFSHASLPVQVQYAADIKKNDCLNSLLEFMFDFLQYSHGKFVDASKLDVRTFVLDGSESDERETQWLLVHLYYLCLKFIPDLTKAWWIDSKKRIKGHVEAWTERYISPLVIEDSLQNVTQWYEIQDQRDEEQPLEIKVSYKSAEIIANIEVDEESPPTSISISLPSAYPLQQAIVTGRSRVAVDEKKWKSWLLTIQGVIMFSNGNLVDGLLAFRKNVQGALKGQGECAICYSIISPSMQTPNKKCATCKNTFHSDCLFRWFKSSNSSSCPLCRNNFLYS